MKKTIPLNARLIPPTAKKVFAGVIYDVYQWPQVMFDGSVQTFEMLKRPDTVQAICVLNGKVLLVRETQPNSGEFVDFPGGKVDPSDESWLAAVKRELLEETGYSISDWKLLHVAQPFGHIERFCALYVAWGDYSLAQQQLDKGGEKIQVEFEYYETLCESVLNGTMTDMNYAAHIFSKYKNVNELIAAPAFVGQDVEL